MEGDSPAELYPETTMTPAQIERAGTTRNDAERRGDVTEEGQDTSRACSYRREPDRSVSSIGDGY